MSSVNVVNRISCFCLTIFVRRDSGWLWPPLATSLNNCRPTARPGVVLLCIAASPANDFRSVTDPGSTAVFPPYLCVFNSAAKSEPHAIEQLAVDILSYDIDIGAISETTLSQNTALVPLSFLATVLRLDRTALLVFSCYLFGLRG